MSLNDTRLIFSVALLVLCCTGVTMAQVGGRYVFDFISIPNSARASALGDYAIAVVDDDGFTAYQNPSLLNSKMHQSLSFSHIFYVDDIGSGYASYAHHFEKSGLTMHAGIHYMQYGEFIRTDELGNEIGTFKAAEYSITGGIGKQLYERLRVGANLRFIISNLETYTATGIGLDLAATYQIEEKDIYLTMVARNAGFQITKYDDEREPVPFDLQIGFSKRLKYLPFRFSVTMHTLNRWDVSYDDPNAIPDDPILGPDPEEDDGVSFIDNFFRHLTFGGEFLIGKSEVLALRFGYNHLRKQELSIDNFRTLAGFSFGFGIKISKFRLDYGFARYHIASSGHHLSISTNLSRFGSNQIVTGSE